MIDQGSVNTAPTVASVRSVDLPAVQQKAKNVTIAPGFRSVLRQSLFLFLVLDLDGDHSSGLLHPYGHRSPAVRRSVGEQHVEDLPGGPLRTERLRQRFGNLDLQPPFLSGE
ncbi:hypothetical protein ACWC9U_36145 [Streptomyces sp. 900116325]